MTAYFDNLSTPDTGAGDFGFANRGTSAIPAGRFVVLDGANLLGSTMTDQLSVTQTGIGATLPSGAKAAGTLGVVLQSVPAAQHGTYRTRGIAAMVNYAGVTAGAFLSAAVASGHEGQVQTAASGEEVCAMALTTGADGAQVLVRILSPFVKP